MTQYESVGSESNGLTSDLVELKNRLNQMGKDNVFKVIGEFEGSLSLKLRSRPYETLVSAFQIGYGATGLKFNFIRKAVIHAGRLVACKVLSDIDQR